MKREGLEQQKQPQRVKYLVDTNIFLEVELDQRKAHVCGEVLRRIHLGELEGVIVDFAIDTIIITMENYGKGWSEIRTFLSSLLGYRGSAYTSHPYWTESKLQTT